LPRGASLLLRAYDLLAIMVCYTSLNNQSKTRPAPIGATAVSFSASSRPVRAPGLQFWPFL